MNWATSHAVSRVRATEGSGWAVTSVVRVLPWIPELLLGQELPMSWFRSSQSPILANLKVTYHTLCFHPYYAPGTYHQHNFQTHQIMVQSAHATSPIYIWYPTARSVKSKGYVGQTLFNVPQILVSVATSCRKWWKWFWFYWYVELKNPQGGFLLKNCYIFYANDHSHGWKIEGTKGFWKICLLPLDSAIYYLSCFPPSFLFILQRYFMLIFVSMNIYYFL